eukprot:5668164-Pleurochrysis_carterae.AAC.2
MSCQSRTHRRGPRPRRHRWVGGSGVGAGEPTACVRTTHCGLCGMSARPGCRRGSAPSARQVANRSLWAPMARRPKGQWTPVEW